MPADDLLDDDRRASAYDYELSADRIAQHPADPRDSARLLVVESPTRHSHRIFRDLPELLQPGDLLVLNDSRVIPARLYGRKPSGAEVELLLLEERSPQNWLALVRPGKRLPPGATILFGEPESDRPFPTAKICDRDEATGGRIVEFFLPDDRPLLDWLDELGKVPLPPYITASDATLDDYQTIYARQPGSAAAPTAGLHFTQNLLDRLQQHNVNITYVTLHVGVGTFRPVEAENITDHTMHSEWLQVSPDTAEAIRATKAAGGRVFAVGTTAVRSIETAAASGEIQPYCGKTELFIYPGYRWRAIDGLITNFHLPHSSLLMLVAALIGRSRLLDLYRDAIANDYRFYSFGDAMFILPEARLGESVTSDP